MEVCARCCIRSRSSTWPAKVTQPRPHKESEELGYPTAALRQKAIRHTVLGRSNKKQHHLTWFRAPRRPVLPNSVAERVRMCVELLPSTHGPFLFFFFFFFFGGVLLGFGPYLLPLGPRAACFKRQFIFRKMCCSWAKSRSRAE